MQHIADFQYGLCPHVDGTPLNIGIGTVRQTGGFGHLCLGHSHPLADGQQLVTDGAKIKNKHLSSSCYIDIGIIVPFLLDKQELKV